MGYLYKPDRTWKSAQDLQTMLDVVGITPDKTVITYCGGGPLSAGVYFTFKHVLGYPNVKNYTISYLGWITDSRDLSVNTYGNDHQLRDTAWMRWWVGDRMQRLVPVSPALAVDVRSEAEYAEEHIPWSVNIPMDDADQVVSTSAATWAEILGEHGAGDSIEVVAVDETVTPQTTLLVWLLEYLGHDEAAIASEGLAGWRDAGHDVSSEETLITEPTNPIDVAIEPLTFTPAVRPELRLEEADAPSSHPFPRVWVVSAETVPEDVPVDTYIQVPWSSNLTEDGLLKAAGDLWTLYEDAGVELLSEIVCYSDDPAEATMTYFVLRLLRFPRVMVYLPADAGL
jgi:3-mercaptopyruvate sulfurtransferase SseA